MAKIKKIHAREILDSRGSPTVQTTIWADTGQATIASVPAGASTGKFEAAELRDEDPNRFGGKGVLKAVDNVNNVIAPEVVGLDPRYQSPIDKKMIEMDGTKDKSKLGANAILSVSQAVAELGAIVSGRQSFEYLAEKYELFNSSSMMPGGLFNLINGGSHGAGNNLDFQEFHVIPSTRVRFSQALETAENIYQTLKSSLKKRKTSYAVGDEGGFAPNLYANTDAVEFLIEATKTAGYSLGKDVFMGLDAAANYFHNSGKYQLQDKSQPLDTNELIDFYEQMQKDYQLFLLEDGLAEDDFKSWAQLQQRLGQNTLIVADDLTATNKDRLQKAIEANACGGVIIKPNQIGTISETVDVVKLCKDNKLTVIVSHRSGETIDDFIADFAVGVGADYVKFGAPSRGERVVKYNRLIAIEDMIEAAKKSQ